MQPLTPPVTDSQSADQGSGRVIDPLRSLRRHKRAAAAVLALVLAAGIPYARKKGKPAWRAEGVLFISPRFLSNLETSEEHQLQSNTQYREFMQQQIRTVNRYDILATVLRQPALMASWKKPNETDRRAIERLQGALQVASVPDTYQVTIGLEGDKAPGLAELVNGVMAVFTAVSQKELLWDADGRLEKLNTEKANLEAEIAGLMERKTHMADQLGTTVFNDSIVNSYDKRLSSAMDALEDARRQRFSAETALSGQAAPGVNATAMDKTMTDTGLSSLRGALNQRKATLLTTIQGLSAQHSGRIAAEKEIKEIDAQIEQLTSQVHARWQSGLEDINQSKYEQAKQLEARIQVEVDRLKGQAESFSRGYQTTLEISDEIARVRRRLNATEDRINFLTLETAAPGFVRVFSPAMTPDLPFQGGRRKLFLIVLLAAVILAIAVPVGLDMLDPRIMTGRELEASAGLPLSGDLTLAGAQRLAVVLKRHMEHLPHKMVVLTGLSNEANSGAVAKNLGEELRSLGLRTLVISGPVHMGRKQSLAGLLQGRARLSECVTRGLNGAPDHMAFGADADLLPADSLTGILAAADYDIVLIAAEPVTKSLATEELVRIAGSALLVVAAERDTKTELKTAMTLLTRLRPAAFGMVLHSAHKHADPITIQKGNQNDAPALLAA